MKLEAAKDKKKYELVARERYRISRVYNLLLKKKKGREGRGPLSFPEKKGTHALGRGCLMEDIRGAAIFDFYRGLLLLCMTFF